MMELETTKKPFFRKYNLYLIFSFLLPAMLMLTIYFMMEVYPIGKNSVLVLDLNAQYVYFFEELRDWLLGDGSLLYSWERSLGGEFMGIFDYYVASPFNFIVALFPEGMMLESLLTLFVLKAGLTGFNFSIFLQYSGREKNRVSTIIFSTIYALTSYAVVNSHNSMWIDAVLFLPLIILGLEKLIDEKKFILYTAVLAVTVIANFYIGYMVCIFVFIYFFFYYASREEKTSIPDMLLKGLRVLLFSVLALGIAAVTIFTIYYSLKFGKNDFSDPSFKLSSKFDYLDLLAKFLPNSYDTVRPEGLPFVFCSVLSLILVPAYFFNKKITVRKKVCAGFLLSILFISFAASTIDIFWHGMQVPNWLNYRYSFMLCFIMITMAHRVFCELDGIQFGKIAGVCGVLVIVIMIIQKFDYDYIDTVSCIWLSLIVTGIYLLVLYFTKTSKQKEMMSLILLVIVSAEILINGYTMMTSLDEDVVFSNRASYLDYLNSLEPCSEYINSHDDGLYRAEITSHRKSNDNFALNLNGLTHSTSTLNASVIKLLNQLGYSSKSHWSKYLGGTPLSDSLLGIKYVIGSERDLEDSMYERNFTSGEYGVYSNRYALPIAYTTGEGVKDLDFSSYTTPFELMNDLVTEMLASDERIEIFKPYEVKETTDNAHKSLVTEEYLKYIPRDTGNDARIIFEFEAVTDDEVFVFFPSDYPREVSLSLNGASWGTFFGNETDRIVSLGKLGKGYNVRFSATLKDENFYVLKDQNYFYYLDSEVFKDVISRLKEGQLNISSHTDTNIKGTIEVGQENSLMFTTIPYDEGWHVYVDGKEQPLVKTADSLLAVEISKGKHVIELNYLPDCFVYGMTISICSLVIFIIIIICYYVIKMKKRKKALAAKKASDEEVYELIENDNNKKTDTPQEETEPGKAPETTEQTPQQDSESKASDDTSTENK